MKRRYGISRIDNREKTGRHRDLPLRCYNNAIVGADINQTEIIHFSSFIIYYIGWVSVPSRVFILLFYCFDPIFQDYGQGEGGGYNAHRYKRCKSIVCAEYNAVPCVFPIFGDAVIYQRNIDGQ